MAMGVREAARTVRDRLGFGRADPDTAHRNYMMDRGYTAAGVAMGDPESRALQGAWDRYHEGAEPQGAGDREIFARWDQERPAPEVAAAMERVMDDRERAAEAEEAYQAQRLAEHVHLYGPDGQFGPAYQQAEIDSEAYYDAEGRGFPGAAEAELDRLIDQAAKDYPEVSYLEKAQARYEEVASENGRLEGPGFTEPPVTWDGYRDELTEQQKDQYWDTPDHDVMYQPDDRQTADEVREWDSPRFRLDEMQRDRAARPGEQGAARPAAPTPEAEGAYEAEQSTADMVRQAEADAAEEASRERQSMGLPAYQADTPWVETEAETRSDDEVNALALPMEEAEGPETDPETEQAEAGEPASSWDRYVTSEPGSDAHKAAYVEMHRAGAAAGEGFPDPDPDRSYLMDHGYETEADHLRPADPEPEQRSTGQAGSAGPAAPAPEGDTEAEEYDQDGNPSDQRDPDAGQYESPRWSNAAYAAAQRQSAELTGQDLGGYGERGNAGQGKQEASTEQVQAAWDSGEHVWRDDLLADADKADERPNNADLEEQYTPDVAEAGSMGGDPNTFGSRGVPDQDQHYEAFHQAVAEQADAAHFQQLYGEAPAPAADIEAAS